MAPSVVADALPLLLPLLLLAPAVAFGSPCAREEEGGHDEVVELGLLTATAELVVEEEAALAASASTALSAGLAAAEEEAGGFAGAGGG